MTLPPITGSNCKVAVSDSRQRNMSARNSDRMDSFAKLRCKKSDGKLQCSETAAKGKSYSEKHCLQMKNQGEKNKREREVGKVTGSGEFSGGGNGERSCKKRRRKDSESDGSDNNSTVVKDLRKRQSIPKKDRADRVVDSGVINSDNNESNFGNGKVEFGVEQRSSTEEQSKSGSRSPVSFCCCFFF